MGAIANMFEVRSGVSPTVNLSRGGDPTLSAIFGGVGSASGQNVNSDTALRVSAVYACITILSQTLAMFPKHVRGVREDGGSDILKSHRIYKQIHNRPNRWQSAFEWYEMMEGMRLLRGNAYAYISSSPGRGMNELIPLHPDRTWPFILTPQGAVYFMYDNSPPPVAGSKLFYQYFPINGESQVLQASEVLHIRGYSTNGIVGIDPIKRVAREAIGLALATEEQGARLFSNGAQISKVFKHPQKLSDTAFDRLKKDLNSGEYTGTANAGKTIILEEGMDISSLSMTMENAQFLETRKFQVEDIARIFNVPLVLIGHGDKAPTYASAEQFFMSFKVHTMQANVVRWESAMERDLLYPSEVGLVEIMFDMDSMMRGDAVARSTYLKNRFGMASITPNGVRVYEGENPSEEEGSNKSYIMSNMVPLALAGQQPAKPGAVKSEVPVEE